MNNNDNRRRRFYVPHQTVARIFDRGIIEQVEEGGFICQPKAIGLPEGAKICSVHSDYCRQSFCFVVEHPSFEPASENCELPEITVEVVTERLPVSDLTVQGQAREVLALWDRYAQTQDQADWLEMTRKMINLQRAVNRAAIANSLKP